ncbi:MAG: DUF481 domain-containing protein, partial [Planctomycetota bacterium]
AVLIVPIVSALGLSSLIAGDTDTIPSWQSGISQWSGDGYEMPQVTHSPQPVLDSADGGLPYTMPYDPQTNTMQDPGLPITETPVFDMPMSSSFVPGPSGNPLSVESSTAFEPAFGNIAPAPIGNAEYPISNTNSPPAAISDFPEPIVMNDAVLNDAILNAAATNASAANASTVNGAPQDLEILPDPADDQLLSQQPTQDPPLQDEVVRWYDYPRRWMSGWDSHAEFGIDGSDGNAVTLALQTGLELKRKSERSTLAVDIDYRKATNRNATVEDNGRFNIDYDYLFADSPWSGFAKYGMEWDRFKAFDLRLNLNGGIGYFWIRDDRTTFVTRLGAGASQEIGAPIDDWIAEAVFGLEAERQLTARQKIKGKVDYFPAWEDFDDFRVVTDLSWEILLDGSENLSLKLAATDRYDSTPQGAEPNDIYYSMLLLYKF